MSQLDEKFKEWFHCVDYVSEKMMDKIRKEGNIVDKIHQRMAIYYTDDNNINYLHRVRFLNDIDEMSLFPITSLVNHHHRKIFLRTVQTMHLMDIGADVYETFMPIENLVTFEIEFHKGDSDGKEL